MDLFDFYIEEGNDFTLERKSGLQTWLNNIVSHYRVDINDVQYVFCNDAYLLDINKTHLDHDTYTDIITFQYSETPIEGEIYISTERVKENAEKFGVSFENELKRVMAHGLLHLIGYKDKTDEDALEMRNQEELCLSIE